MMPTCGILRALPQVRNQVRQIVSGPPSQRVPFAEQVFHGVLIAVGCCAFPVWVYAHLREYRGIDKKPEA